MKTILALVLLSILPLGARADSLSAAGPTAAAEPAKAEVTGFRSAKFGMSEGEVRQAVLKDFGIKADGVKAEVHPVERTRVLTVRVPNLLPRGGAALAAYIFGFSTGKLVQVNVAWSKDSDPAATPEMLVGTANLLRGHFETQGFQRDSIVVNAMTPDHKSILVFRGIDNRKRMVLLLLSGSSQTKQEESTALTPVSLQLSYILNSEKPDIFSLSPGQF